MHDEAQQVDQRDSHIASLEAQLEDNRRWIEERELDMKRHLSEAYDEIERLRGLMESGLCLGKRVVEDKSVEIPSETTPPGESDGAAARLQLVEAELVQALQTLEEELKRAGALFSAHPPPQAKNQSREAWRAPSTRRTRKPQGVARAQAHSLN